MYVLLFRPGKTKIKLVKFVVVKEIFNVISSLGKNCVTENCGAFVNWLLRTIYFSDVDMLYKSIERP